MSAPRKMSWRRRRAVARILAWRCIHDAIGGGFLGVDAEMEAELKFIATSLIPRSVRVYEQAENDHRAWQEGKLR